MYNGINTEQFIICYYNELFYAYISLCLLSLKPLNQPQLLHKFAPPFFVSLPQTFIYFGTGHSKFCVEKTLQSILQRAYYAARCALRPYCHEHVHVLMFCLDLVTQHFIYYNCYAIREIQ